MLSPTDESKSSSSSVMSCVHTINTDDNLKTTPASTSEACILKRKEGATRSVHFNLIANQVYMPDHQDLRHILVDRAQEETDRIQENCYYYSNRELQQMRREAIKEAQLFRLGKAGPGAKSRRILGRLYKESRETIRCRADHTHQDENCTDQARILRQKLAHLYLNHEEDIGVEGEITILGLERIIVGSVLWDHNEQARMKAYVKFIQSFHVGTTSKKVTKHIKRSPRFQQTSINYPSRVFAQELAVALAESTTTAIADLQQ